MDGFGLGGLGEDEVNTTAFNSVWKRAWDKVNLALALDMREIICGFNERAVDIAWIQDIQRDWVVDSQ